MVESERVCVCAVLESVLVNMGTAWCACLCIDTHETSYSQSGLCHGSSKFMLLAEVQAAFSGWKHPSTVPVRGPPP